MYKKMYHYNGTCTCTYVIKWIKLYLAEQSDMEFLIKLDWAVKWEYVLFLIL